MRREVLVNLSYNLLKFVFLLNVQEVHRVRLLQLKLQLLRLVLQLLVLLLHLEYVLVQLDVLLLDLQLQPFVFFSLRAINQLELLDDLGVFGLEFVEVLVQFSEHVVLLREEHLEGLRARLANLDLMARLTQLDTWQPALKIPRSCCSTV